jgi:CheY-like chemotaxis protein
VENDPATALLTKHAFREAGLHDGVYTVPNGDEALALLQRADRYSQMPYPDMIFLDLHLPKRSGLEILEELKSNPRLKATPVIVISGSADPREVRKAYELHASCYIRKPDDLYEFLEFIKICFQFWSSLVSLPGKPDLAPQPVV